MDIHVTGRKIRLNSDLKEHAISQIEALEHIFDHIQRCDVVFSKDGKAKDNKFVEIVLHTNGHFLTAKESTDDFFKSVDNAIEKIEHQLVTYKSKLMARKKNTPAKAKQKSKMQVKS